MSLLTLTRADRATIVARLTNELFPVLSAGDRAIVDVDAAHAGVTALCGCVCGVNERLALRWDDCMWPTAWFASSAGDIDESAHVVRIDGDPAAEWDALWFDALGTLPAPDIAALSAAAGVPLRSLFHFDGARRLTTVSAFFSLIDAMERAFMKGRRVVVCLSADPTAAYMLGSRFQGLGRYPAVKFVEKAPGDETLMLAGERG